MAAAALALMERVEPNWAMESTSVQIGVSCFGEAGAFLAEEEDAPGRQLVGLQGDGPREVVDADHGKAALFGVRREAGQLRMVADVLVAVRHHRAAAVPFAVADDVHLLGEEGVRSTDDRADVQVVLPVLDRDMERMPLLVEVLDDRLEPPVPVFVHHVAPIAGREQLGIEAWIVRRIALPRADPDLGGGDQIGSDQVTSILGIGFLHGSGRYPVRVLPHGRDADAELDGPGIPAELAG